MGANDLAGKKCKPCEGGVEPLSGAEARALLEQVPGWELVDEAFIRRRFKFIDFRQAQSWLNAVADIAENEDHHPDIQWSYNKVTIDLSTHSIGGLSQNDYILAAKINELD
jgi:4a-hydroxytetrahydrobiopterin dehydratase